MSHYPPGVSGNEPPISGEYPVDPHNPFFAVRWIDVDRGVRSWAVFYGNDEDPALTLYTEAEAQAQAEAWNEAIPGCAEFYRNGVCRWCGEPSPEYLEKWAEAEQEHLARERRSR